MISKNCDQCHKQISLYPSRFRKAKIHFCSKSCHRTYKNINDNPSKNRDLAGENNPMYGRHPEAWNKGITGEQSHNWKGGIHTRKDGYVRINIKGERKLYHRHVLGDILKSTDIVHHKDHNPTNNSIDNLMIFANQSEHVKYESSSRTKHSC